MKADMAESIYNWLIDHYNIVVIEETGKLHYYNEGVYLPFSDTKLKNLIKHFLADPVDFNEEVQRYSTSLFSQIKNHLHGNMVSLKDFDKNIDYINCLNGKVDIKFNSFTPHFEFNEFPYKAFIQIPIEYDPDAKCPNINKFLIDVFGADRIAFIYEIIGYLLYRSNKLHKAFIFFGEASSGKTTFIELLRTFLGLKNCQDISIQKINQRFQMSNLRNRLANIYDDLPIKKLNYIANFKQVVTNKTLTGEIKGVQDLVTWDNYCKQIYTTNKLPEVAENTGDDFWRRIILIHCTNFFDNGTKDFNISEKITTREELSGLLNMAIFHLKNLLERKHFRIQFDNIETVKGIWQINISPMKLFLDECCVIDKDGDNIEEVKHFRIQVNAFRKEKNAEPISQNLITRRLKDLGVNKVRKSDQKYYYEGISITKTIIDKIDNIILGKKEVILDEF